MSLITMGWGHLSTMTMGLGNSFRIRGQQVLRRYGTVSFEDTTPEVTTIDRDVAVGFTDSNKGVSIK